MYEYEVIDTTTNERTYIYGINWNHAILRAGLEEKDKAGQIECVFCDYLD